MKMKQYWFSRFAALALLMLNRAQHLLLPLKNWPGVARAYAARAQANKALGNFAAAGADSIEQARYQGLIGER